MIRTWIAVALLAGAWLFGLSYLEPANPWAFVATVVVAAFLLGGRLHRLPGRWATTTAVILLLPAVWFMPLPYKAAPLLMAAGLAVELAAMVSAATALSETLRQSTSPDGAASRRSRAKGAARRKKSSTSSESWPPKIPEAPTLDDSAQAVADPTGAADARRVPWPVSVARGATLGGVILFCQAIVLTLYASLTARSHDLPAPLAHLVGGIVRLLGVDAVVDGGVVALRSAGKVHRLAATWELFFDPATLCFLVGGLVVLAIAAGQATAGTRRSLFGRGAAALLLIVVAWLPLRVALLTAIYLARDLRVAADTPPAVSGQFLSAWICLLLLAGPVFLAARFLRIPSSVKDDADGEKRNPWQPRQAVAAVASVAVAAAIVAVAVQWVPVGRRKAGRVMFVERHSTWEPTGRPYSTDWYCTEEDEEAGKEADEKASYNYAAVYDYLSQYYQMSRLEESDTFDRETLDSCDVLVIKTPTARYSRDEVEAIHSFVRRGGSLLLIGDHTNVFNSSTYMNDITRALGFTFRHDLLFGTGRADEQQYRPPAVPHPAVQHVPAVNFHVSCSIDPGLSSGRAIVQNTGLWSLPPFYHAENYYPEAEYRPEMRYGAFIQTWSTSYGKGRVTAFTDSTIFSSFCTYQEGKAELLRGMIEWLNHGSKLDPFPVRALLAFSVMGVGIALLAGGIWVSRDRRAVWILLMAAGVFGFTLASMGVAVPHRLDMRVPKVQRPMQHVVIDRTVSDTPLFLGAFPTSEPEKGYGLFEQWIPKLGYVLRPDADETTPIHQRYIDGPKYFTSRQHGEAVFTGDALVILCPNRSVPRDYVRQLMKYVEEGGRVLVVDSPDNAGSTANSLLWDFGMTVDHAASKEGTLHVSDDWPAITLPSSCQITGGEPIAVLDGMVVAAKKKHGKGSVTAVGFGFLFNDAHMGVYWWTEPDEDMLQRYAVLFSLLKTAMEE